MFSLVPTLGLRDLQKWTQNSEGDFRMFEGYEDFCWTLGGAESLAFICKNVSPLKDRALNIYLPAYFCGQSMRFLRSLNFKLCFYKLDENLLPDYSSIIASSKKNPVDVLVHVHYFGQVSGQKQSRVVADELGAVLIEDCAHVLSPFAMKFWVGDYLIFSPHKHFPLPKIGLVISKMKLANNPLLKNQGLPFLWLMKELVRRIKRKKASPKWGRIWSEKSENYQPSDLNFLVKRIAAKYLLNYQFFQNKRLENQSNMLKILKSFGGWKPIINVNQSSSPYILGMICDTEEIAIRRFNFLNKESQIVMQWPDLPYETRETVFEEEICKLVDRTLFFFNHHKIDVNNMLKALVSQKNKDNF